MDARRCPRQVVPLKVALESRWQKARWATRGVAMQTSEALKIIQALVDGIDPTTGEVFAGDSPYQHPQVLRALFAAAKALERQGQNERRPRSLPENAGRA